MNKKGFTLIELLAVILVLGIIALIAIPTITNIINESKKGSFKSTVYNMVKAAEQQCQMEKIKGEEITKYYRFEDNNNLQKLSIKGNNPDNGSIIVDDECNVDLVLNQDNYIAVKQADKDDLDIIEEKYYKTGSEISYNPGDNNYNTWYVLKDNGNTVTLLLDKNIGSAPKDLFIWATLIDYIESGGTKEDYYQHQLDKGPITANKGLKSLTASWKTEAKENIRLLSVDDILEVLAKSDWNDLSFYFDTKSETAPVISEDSEYVSKYAWLYNNLSDCNKYGCSKNGNSFSDYWLSTSKSNSTNEVYAINNVGSLVIYENIIIDERNEYFGSLAGIRPVITISKNLLQ